MLNRIYGGCCKRVLADLTEMITDILAVNPGRELDILRALDNDIGIALAQVEGSADESTTPD